MVLENAFGRLKGRWRCLLKQNERDFDIMADVIAACCVLHNICERNDETFDDQLLPHERFQEDAPQVAHPLCILQLKLQQYMRCLLCNVKKLILFTY